MTEEEDSGLRASIIDEREHLPLEDFSFTPEGEKRAACAFCGKDAPVVVVEYHGPRLETEPEGDDRYKVMVALCEPGTGCPGEEVAKHVIPAMLTKVMRGDQGERVGIEGSDRDV